MTLIVQTRPYLRHLSGLWYPVTGRLYPTGVAYGFLLASQLSCSLGMTPILLGWLIKLIVLKYGGGRWLYRGAIGFVFGAVAGDLLGGLVFIVVGAVYYAVTGFRPPEHRIFPQ